jgi:ubiquinone/menaquinone biosynthesis C-methylase UbiE
VTNTANAAQYAAWNGESGQRWIAHPDRRDRVMAPIAGALLDAARLAPGEHVVDIGCGCGATTLAAARAVAPTGDVVGVDLSAPMLGVARQRANAASLTNVHFEQADAQTHQLPPSSFDVAISRFGTMFFGDPGAAFANLATALQNGGRLRIATWQPLAANDWLTIPGTALLRYGSMPEATAGPGMFSQSDPPVLDATLRAAGFSTVDVTPITVALTLGVDPDDAADYLADTGVGRAMLDTVPQRDRPAALHTMRTVLAEHLSPSGVQLGAAILITTATRS